VNDLDSELKYLIKSINNLPKVPKSYKPHGWYISEHYVYELSIKYYMYRISEVLCLISSKRKLN